MLTSGHTFFLCPQNWRKKPKLKSHLVIAKVRYWENSRAFPASAKNAGPFFCGSNYKLDNCLLFARLMSLAIFSDVVRPVPFVCLFSVLLMEIEGRFFLINDSNKKTVNECFPPILIEVANGLKPSLMHLAANGSFEPILPNAALTPMAALGQ